MRKIRLQELRRQFELVQMKSTESVKDFIGTIKEIVNDMESNGKNLEEVRVVEKVMRSLTAKFHTKKAVLEATKDLDNLSLAELEGELLTYEMSLNQQPLDTVEEMLQAKEDHPKGKEEVNRIDTNQRGQNFRGRGHGGRGNFRGHGRGNFLTNPEIILIGIRKTINRKVKEIIFKCVIDLMCNVIIVVKLVIIRMNVGPIKRYMLKGLKIVVIERRPSSSTAEESMKNDWFIDSSYSNHICGKKEMFFDLDESFHASVRFENNEKVHVLGKGKIRIILQDGSSNYISDVFYVPSEYHNLLSLG
ncbi:uncharacterized protein [Coffea arabica]|uniref:Retrovirus-related Pol polyprotein from transposon TNT 1-94-like beta-barrel domain-containing protein n=1 Tax=Coffea arabica TaxID=13443 RepID=A0A6P6SP72_COFAR